MIADINDKLLVFEKSSMKYMISIPEKKTNG
jgi:hypothetical protein